MGLFGEKLPEGYEIREETVREATEYTIYRNGQKTYYTTFVRSHAVAAAKRMHRDLDK